MGQALGVSHLFEKEAVSHQEPWTTLTGMSSFITEGWKQWA